MKTKKQTEDMLKSFKRALELIKGDNKPEQDRDLINRYEGAIIGLEYVLDKEFESYKGENE